jgi:putative membrane protein
MRLLVVWLINTLALIAVAYLLPGVSIATFGSALVAASCSGSSTR